MYRACIFDLDGTLANTLESIAYFSNGALARCGYRQIPTADYRHIVGDGADMQMHRMLNAVCGTGNYTEEQVAALRKVYDKLYESDPMHLVVRYEGMQETLDALKKSDIKTAVLSNKPHGLACSIIGSLYRRGSFDLCYGQRPQVPRKPAPDGALLIAGELGFPPRECLYLGDTNTDMKTGAAAGMDTVGVLWGFRDREELVENHACFLAEKPGEIVRIAGADMR